MTHGSERPHHSEPPRLRRSDYPLRDNWVAVVFMISLLVIAGVTASIAGYRIKAADKDRKAQLLRAYEQLGGSRDILIIPEQTINQAPSDSEASTFIAAYEVNERSRALGLYRYMEGVAPASVPSTIKALDTIGANDPARVLENSWKAFEEQPTHSAIPSKNAPLANPQAARLAKKYDRYMARDVETKLFKYFVDHREQIFARQTGQ
jgi:hypothetical protein